MKNNYFKFFILFSIAAILNSCAPVAIALGAGATVGVASMQEGGLFTAASDAKIKVQIMNNWVNSDFDIFRKLNITVKEGRVLITGSVPDADMRVEAVRLAWKVEGVKQVLNEISVDNQNDFGTTVSDSIITGSIKTRVMFDKKINSINYNIETNNGNVYIIGIARNQEELDKVIDYARNTKDVKNVINYARVSGTTKVGDKKEEPVKNYDDNFRDDEPSRRVPMVEPVESSPIK